MLQNLSFLQEKGPETLHLDEIHISSSILELLDDDSVRYVVSGLVTSAIVGSYFKSSVYFYMYDKRKELKNRPINILILLQSVIQHVTNVLISVVLATGLLLDITFAEIFGETWCGVLWHIGTFGISYRSIGSLGIAIFRMMYLFRTNLVKERIGTGNMCALIAILSIVSSELMTFGFGVGNGPASRQQEFTNFCIGKSGEFREIEHEYALLRGLVHPEREYAALMLLLTLGAVIAELCCYIIVFRHLYIHDKRLMNRKILPANEINRRHQKNATTLLGQFYGFGIETIFYFGVLLSLKSKSDNLFRVGLMIGIWVEFGLLSVVEVMTSHFLKQNLPHNRFCR